jgi:hypothetical protein
MLFLKRLFGLAGIFFLSMLLAGCFTTPTKLLGDYGDRLQFGPTVSCANDDYSVLPTYAVTEERSPSFPSRFRYVGNQGGGNTTVVAKEIGESGLYLLQMSTAEGYQYLWYREMNHDVFYFDSEWMFAEEDALKYNVTISATSTQSFDIEGTPEAMLDFLEEVTDDLFFLPIQLRCYWTIH